MAPPEVVARIRRADEKRRIREDDRKLREAERQLRKTLRARREARKREREAVDNSAPVEQTACHNEPSSTGRTEGPSSSEVVENTL